MHAPPLKDRAKGRWRGILAGLGVDARHLTGQHTACPMCGGKDRWRFDDLEGRGTFICTHCGAGDGIDLVKRLRGIEFKEAAVLIEEQIGAAPFEPDKPGRTDEQRRQAMRAAWVSSSPIQATDAAGRYLAARCGILSYPACLRFSPRLRYQDDPPSWYPGMLALVTDASGKPVNLHRTYLTKDGAKADVEAPRRLMEGGVPKGSAVRLFEHGDTLGISEGIENAFAASGLFGIPCWAALNSSRLAEWRAPEGVRHVVVFGDNDAKFGGQAAAYRCAHMAYSRDCTSEVRIPADAGTDWDDVWRETRSAERVAA